MEISKKNKAREWWQPGWHNPVPNISKHSLSHHRAVRDCNRLVGIVRITCEAAELKLTVLC